MLKIKNLLFLLICSLLVWVALGSVQVSAAVQTKEVSLIPIDMTHPYSDPTYGGTLISTTVGGGTVITKPASSTSSGLLYTNGPTQEGPIALYSWIIDMSEICDSAQIISAHGRLNVTASDNVDNENDAVFVFMSEQGVADSALPTAVNEGSSDNIAVTRGSNTGIPVEGPVDAVWGVDSRDISLHAVVAFSGSEVGEEISLDNLQMSVEYDDSSCSDDSGPSAPVSVGAAPKPPAAGFRANGGILSVFISTGLVLMIAARWLVARRA